MGRCVLVVNTAHPEVNHLAAGLADSGMLSWYVRPYVNLERGWERFIAKLPGAGKAYSDTFGRRRMPTSLTQSNLKQSAIMEDIALSLFMRAPIRSHWRPALQQSLIRQRSMAIGRAAVRSLKHEKVVVASWWCALPVFKEAKKRGIITVLNYPMAHHDFTSRYLQKEALLEPEFSGTLRGDELNSFETAWLNQEIELADHILVGSDFVKESFIQEGVQPEKLCVIPYGSDTSLFTPPVDGTKDDGSFNIVFTGQLSQRKGLSYLLRAYKQIQSPETTLTLVGRMTDGGGALAPWADLFVHKGSVPQPQLREIYAQADVFAFPTLIEGMPLSLIEAMACGLPVVTTPNGPLGIVRDGVEGFIVAPRDVNALATRLQQMKEDRALRRRMGQEARKRAQEYSWARYKREVVNTISAWTAE